jgi:hypothetical protein
MVCNADKRPEAAANIDEQPAPLQPCRRIEGEYFIRRNPLAAL